MASRIDIVCFMFAFIRHGLAVPAIASATSGRKQNVDEGDRVEIDCVARGTPRPKVSWSKLEGPLPPTAITEKSFLIIPEARPEDSGTYLCSATNVAGTAEYSVHLFVQPYPFLGLSRYLLSTQVPLVSESVNAVPAIASATSGRKQNVDEGDRVEIDCVARGTPRPKVSWSRLEGPLPPTAITEESFLIIPEARPEDSGTYLCSATNVAGTTEFSIQLFVQPYPFLGLSRYLLSTQVPIVTEFINAKDMKVRLVNGTSEAGRLEIFFREEWSTVCDMGFGSKETMVACRMLGFHRTDTRTVSSARYGAGTGSILPLYLACDGTETSLAQCIHTPYSNSDCNHMMDIGVMCNTTEEMSARLVNGTAEAGRLEIFFDEEWSTVCEWGFGKEDALVACRMLGFNSTEAEPVSSARYGAGSGSILFDNLGCRGTEISLAECQHGPYYSRSCNHQQDVGVICNIAQQMQIRLSNGTSNSGRLEIFLGGEWSTVCDDSFEKEDAVVACRMLGFNSTAAAVVSSAGYGPGSGRILLDDVGCQGTESSLTQCPHNGLYKHDCGHSEDVGVICLTSEDMTVRLVNGTAEAGRLEIFFNGEWSTVCEGGFGKEDALVACRMLGFNSTEAAPVSSARFGKGSGRILHENVGCRGTETSLAECQYGLYYSSSCNHQQDVGVVCNVGEDQTKARLVNGTSQAGRLEIFFSGEWSTVCNDNFGKEDALVACRMLGFNSTSAAAVSSRKYGPGSGRILLDDVGCRGTESSLTQCPHNGLYKHNCGHSEDVGVICITSEDMTARLVNGTTEAGRLEIFFNGEWHTVCERGFGVEDALVACRMLGFNSWTDDSTFGERDFGSGTSGLFFNGEWSTVCEQGFGREDALVACRMLGFNGSEAAAVSSVRYGAGSDRILFDNLECRGTETSLAKCQQGPYYSRTCGHQRDVGVICNAAGQMTARLVNGTSEAGRLEIFFNGEWSTVCERGFGREDALVACRMLGFNGTEAASVGSARYGSGTGTILFENLECSGTETSLAQCQHGTYYSRSCNHQQDVGVICNVAQQMQIRVSNGTSSSGRLEIFFNGEWSTVCDDSFDKEAAVVVCRMLGFNSTAAAAVSSSRYGPGSGRILLDDVGCRGTESSLTQCTHNGLYKHDCGHSEDVGVICITSGDMTARLVNGTAEAGRLEMFFNGEWNTVCEQGFGKEDALVACRMLGFNSSEAAVVSSVRYGAGSDTILFDNLECRGTETSLAQCQHGPYYSHSCGHQQDVGVICNAAGQMTARLVNGTAEAGRLEIFFNGEWSTVCEQGFGREDALVACRMLGFNGTEAVSVGSAKYGSGTGTILFENLGCSGTETSLAQCQHGTYYSRSCNHQQDVGVICNVDRQTKARLVNGTLTAGRLEIFVDGEWTTVCDDHFGKEDALVACRMLGFNSTAAVAVSSGRYGQGSGRILLDDVGCRGTESSLTQCPHSGLYKHDCGHSEDVGVICITSEEMTARLVNGTAEAGRLEIFFNGEWTTVCELGFGTEDALVACRMLGFNSIRATPVSSVRYGAGTGAILFDNLACQGTETSLAECQHGPYYNHSCSHQQDVGVICSMATPTAPTMTVGGQVSNYTVSVSNYVDFRCTVGASYGQPLELFKVTSNGTQPLKSSEATVLLFRLENTACEDAGTYICRAKNRTDQNNTASAQLHVLCSPQLASGNIIDPVQVTEGSDGQVTFEVTAHPVPTLASFTYREEDNTSRSEEQPVRSGLLSGSCEGHALAAHLAVCRLDITNPAVTDFGVYNVKVRNSIGTTNVTFTLNVIDLHDEGLVVRCLVTPCTDLLTVCWRYTSQCQETWMQEGCRKTCSGCSMFEETTAAVTSQGDIDRKEHGVSETATRTVQCGNYTSRGESSDLGVMAGAAEESVIRIRDRLEMMEADIELLRTRLAEISGKLDELASQSREIKSKSLSQLSRMEADSKHQPVN